MVTDPCGGISYPTSGTAVITQNGQTVTFFKPNMTNGKGDRADTMTGTLDADGNGFAAGITFGDLSSGQFTNTITLRNTATSGTYSTYISMKRSYSTSSGCVSTFTGTVTKI